jgi:hypothetical protein
VIALGIFLDAVTATAYAQFFCDSTTPGGNDGAATLGARSVTCGTNAGAGASGTTQTFVGAGAGQNATGGNDKPRGR